MKTTNLSKIRRDKMLDTISEIKKKINDENILTNLSMIENELTKKKYGLIWEEHEERVDTELETQIPTFEEIKDKEILSDECTKFNFLLEGDNLHSLYLLKKTHKEKIDVIYIDPPYNTGINDFVYDDNMIGREDLFKHSKWLSFMNKRLSIAQSLLSNKGIIFISIDDNEQAQLKLLCDDIFGYNNCLGILPTIMNLKGNQDQFGFAGTHEYTLVYAKNISECSFGEFEVEEEEIEKQWSIDEIGYFKKGANLKSTGVNAPRLKRPNLYFPIYVKVNEDNTINWDINYFEKSTEIFPITNNEEMSWRWSKTKFENEKHNVIVNFDFKSSTVSFYKKQRPNLNDIPTKKPKSFFYKPEYSSGNGTNQLMKLFGNKVFNNPKPIELIKDFLRISSTKNSIILDFFAGSGTTGHAILELNKEDNGNRKFILCTNNENEICEKITYERLKMVINGHNDVKGIPANFKYYKTAYIPRVNTEKANLHNNLLINIKNLIQLENGIKIDDKQIKVYLDEKELDKFSVDKEALTECNKVYISSDILLTSEQEKTFEDNSIEVYIIPEYYFKNEILEVA